MIEVQLRKALHTANGPMHMEVQLDIEPGAFLAITGPYGSGKTTLLRMIAGLEQPEQGKITVNGTTWLDTAKKTKWPIQDREVGMVFQDYALFPNMTVRQNLEYALRKGQTKEIVKELVQITELNQLLEQYPAKLSGGQQQRVALARALVPRPKLLLLDEPLSALDPRMRIRLQNYILKVHRTFELTTLIVSHDYREIFKLADRVILLEKGKTTQPDFPDTIQYAHNNQETLHLTGEVLHFEETGTGFSADILIGDNLIRVPITTEEIRYLQPGDRVNVFIDTHQLSLKKV